MAKRHARVKLSRAQKLENERNRWLAKKDAAIAMLVKSMERLKSLNRSVARMERTAQLPVKAKVANMTLAEIKAEPVEQKVGWVFPEAKPVDDGLDIPKDLDRRLNGLSDPRTKEKKAERRAVEKEVREAELTGKRRKMPLSGKAAMEAILGEAIHGKPDAAAREARMKSLGFRKTKR